MKKRITTVSSIAILVLCILAAHPNAFPNQKLCLQLRLLSWKLAKADDSEKDGMLQDQGLLKERLVWSGYLVEKAYELKHIEHNTPQYNHFVNKLREFLKSDCSTFTAVELGHVEPDRPKNDILVITVRDKPTNMGNWDEFVAKECK